MHHRYVLKQCLRSQYYCEQFLNEIFLCLYDLHKHWMNILLQLPNTVVPLGMANFRIDWSGNIQFILGFLCHWVIIQGPGATSQNNLFAERTWIFSKTLGTSNCDSLRGIYHRPHTASCSLIEILSTIESILPYRAGGRTACTVLSEKHFISLGPTQIWEAISVVLLS